MITLKNSLLIENDSDLFSFRFSFDNILMWPFIRVFYHRILINKEYKLSSPQASLDTLNLKEKMDYGLQSFLQNPLRRKFKRPFDIIIFCSGITNIKRGNSYFNRVSDYFAFLYRDRTLLIEDSLRKRFNRPRAFPHVGYRDAVVFKAYLRSRFTRNNTRDLKTINNLLQFLKESSPFAIESTEISTIGETLKQTARRLAVYKSFYEKIFDRQKPKIIFLEDASYGYRSYILKWAQERNITTVEHQHGLVSPNHEAYNYGKAILLSTDYREYLPDYFLTYGTFWNDLINIPVKKIPIGNPYYSDKIKDTIFQPSQDGGKKTILIISGGNLPEIIKETILSLGRLVDPTVFEIVFRPHPQEIHLMKDRFEPIINHQNITIDSEDDLYKSLSKADFVAGEFSTILFEALGLCKGVFVLKHPVSDLHVPQNLIRRFRDAQDLYDLITKAENDRIVNRDQIWHPNWESQFRDFIDSIL